MTKKDCMKLIAVFFETEKGKSSLFLYDLLAIVISASLADSVCEDIFTALGALYHAGKVELPNI